MDQDDLEDELIWKTVVAHFDMASEKISYRLRGALGSAETLVAITLGAIVIVGWVLRSSREEEHNNIPFSYAWHYFRKIGLRLPKRTSVSDAFHRRVRESPCLT